MSKIITFPFTFIRKTRLGLIYRPYISVLVFSRRRNRWQPVEMVIDTGADYCLFPKRYAEILGIECEVDCIAEKTLGIGGIEAVYQYKELPIKLGDWEGKVPVGFLERDDVPPLLGRLNCFEAWRVAFEKKSTFVSTS